MILVYIILLILLGYSFIELLSYFKLTDKNNLSSLDHFAFSFSIGTMLFTIYMFIIGFLNIKYGFFIFYPVLFNAMILIIFFIKKIFLTKNKLQMLKLFVKKKVSLLSKEDKNGLILGVIIIIFIILFLTDGLANYLKFPDEFSHWGIQAKNIFESGKMNIFTPTKNEVYPNFLPLLYSGYYYFAGGIQENSIRIIQVLFLICLYFNLISFIKIKKLNILLFKFLFCIFVTCYSIIGDISSSTYADISFMYYYSLSSILLVEWVFNRKNKNNLIFSGLLLIGALWTKRDGYYLVLFSYFLLFIYKIFNKKLMIQCIKMKTILFYIGATICVPMMWILYTKIHAFPTDLNNFDLRLDYYIPMMGAINKQLYTDLYSAIMVFLTLKILIFDFSLFQKKKQFYLLSLIIYAIVNVAFLVLCYLTMFGGEGPIAASFIRYISRIIPIIMIFIVVSCSPTSIDNK